MKNDDDFSIFDKIIAYLFCGFAFIFRWVFFWPLCWLDSNVDWGKHYIAERVVSAIVVFIMGVMEYLLLLIMLVPCSVMYLADKIRGKKE